MWECNLLDSETRGSSTGYAKKITRTPRDTLESTLCGGLILSIIWYGWQEPLLHSVVLINIHYTKSVLTPNFRNLHYNITEIQDLPTKASNSRRKLQTTHLPGLFPDIKMFSFWGSRSKECAVFCSLRTHSTRRRSSVLQIRWKLFK